MKVSLESRLTGALVVGLVAAASLAFSEPAPAEEARTGKLIVEVKPFESEVELKPKVLKQLEHGGLVWGTDEGTLIVTLVAPNYVNADFSHLTRYGSSEEVELPAGTYRITCVGYLHESNSRKVDKALAKSAFFNIDVLTFEIRPDRATTLQVLPVIRKQSHLSPLVKVKVFAPEFSVTVVEDGVATGSAVINQRTPQSVGWAEYSGPLKFES